MFKQVGLEETTGYPPPKKERKMSKQFQRVMLHQMLAHAASCCGKWSHLRNMPAVEDAGLMTRLVPQLLAKRELVPQLPVGGLEHGLVFRGGLPCTPLQEPGVQVSQNTNWGLPQCCWFQQDK